MAYSISYLESNGVKITAGDTYFLTVNVYRMKSDYTWEQTVEDEIIAVDNSYDVSYASYGVYKITIQENITTYTYADINYCSHLVALGTCMKNSLCCEDKCNVKDYKDEINFQLLINRYLGETTYTIFSTTDFTSSVTTNDLIGIRDALERMELYGANITEDTSCC